MNHLHLSGNQNGEKSGGDADLSWIEKQGIHPWIFAFFVLIIVFVLYQVIGGLLTVILFGIQPSQNNLFGFRLATGVGQIVFILLPTLVFVRLAAVKSAEYLRIYSPRPSALFIPLIGIISLQPMLQIYLIFQERIPLPQEIQTFVENIQEAIEKLYTMLVGSDSVPELLWVILIVAVIPSIAEEFMFRGLIQRAIEKSLSPMKSVLITGFIFSAYHLNPFTFIPLFVIGVYLGFILIRSGSIWVPIVVHFVNNALACITLYFHMDDDYVIVGNAGKMSNAALIAAFCFSGLIFFVSLLYFIKVTERPAISSSSSYPGGNTDG